MVILDTNHYSEYEAASVSGRRLREKLESSTEIAVMTVVTMQEVTRGRLATIQASASGPALVMAYERFHQSVVGLAGWLTLPWTTAASAHFERLERLRSKIGTHDLRIACIALEQDATVLTRNLVDFQKVPGLKVENWLD